MGNEHFKSQFSDFPGTESFVACRTTPTAGHSVQGLGLSNAGAVANAGSVSK